jgi:tetratricopeptide (TPR) repeat protein
MIRRRAALTEGDNETTTRTKVADMVSEHVPDETERRWIEPAMLALLGFESGVPAEQLFGAWRRFFERLASSAPVVLVFEDFHHADAGLVDFVDQLLDLARAVPLYVLTLARPDFLERRPSWGVGKRSFTSLFLEPLPPAAMRELLAGLVPGLPETAVEAIVRRADGIPLYAIETVRMLLAEGRLTRDGDRYEPHGDLSQLAIPETLTALIASRLDALPAVERGLISDGAVLGQTFSVAGLAAVSGHPMDSLNEPLRALVRRELLRLETDSHSPELGQYGFVQALIREVAYNTLAKAERRTRHVAAARYLESLETDEIAGALAGHYLAAYRNSPAGPAADAAASQARIALRSAGDRAAALGAYDAALPFFNQALEIANDPAEQADLRERAGRAASSAGRFELAEQHFRAAIDATRITGDRSARARITAALGHCLGTARHADVAVKLLEAADAEFADMSDDPGAIAVVAALSRAIWLDGDLARALPVVERALPLAERHDRFEDLANLLITKGVIFGSTGRVVEGDALQRAGQEVAEAHGFSLTVVRALLNRSSATVVVSPRQALEIARDGLALAERLGLREYKSTVVVNAAWAAHLGDEWDWAVQALEAALADDYESGDRGDLLEPYIALRGYRGLPIDDQVAEVERLLSGSTDTFRRGSLVGVRGYAAFFAGRYLEAHDLWMRLSEFQEQASIWPFPMRAAVWARALDVLRADTAAWALTSEHGAAVDAHQVAFGAAIAAMEGRREDALRGYADAMRRLRDLDQPFFEAMTATDMAIVLDPAEPAVRAAAEVAHAYFEQVDAAGLLRILNAQLERSSPASRPGVAQTEPAPSL